MSNAHASADISRWEDIPFTVAEEYVKKLQRHIANKRYYSQFDKVFTCQQILVHSFYAKALAVKAVTSNKGKNTAGVDGVVWDTPEKKYAAIFALNRRGYKPQPLKRVFIPKYNGSKRPLGIPTMKDRAMQTLYKFALEPIAEVTGDVHSFGFRAGRSAKDAITLCEGVLSGNSSYEWILKCDIESCFDNISHDWILTHIPLDKSILQKFIQSGYIENSIYHPTSNGIPQGGCLSRIICNMTLDSLENKLLGVCDNIQFIRYADDIIIISDDKNLLSDTVMNTTSSFLAERGLQLSERKTSLIHIEDGFDFLGWNVRRYGDDIYLKPSEKNINQLFYKVSAILTSDKEGSYENLRCALRRCIAGWINYHRGIVIDYSLCDVEYDLVTFIFGLTNDSVLASDIGSLFPEVGSR